MYLPGQPVDFAEEIGIGDLAGLLDVATLDHFAAESFDFLAGHFAEILVRGLARFELLAIDEEGARTGEAVAGFIVVTEESESAGVVDRRLAVCAQTIKAGDVIVHGL
jgi:hypothetical protein